MILSSRGTLGASSMLCGELGPFSVPKSKWGTACFPFHHHERKGFPVRSVTSLLNSPLLPAFLVGESMWGKDSGQGEGTSTASSSPESRLCPQTKLLEEADSDFLLRQRHPHAPWHHGRSQVGWGSPGLSGALVGHTSDPLTLKTDQRESPTLGFCARR